VKALLWVWLIFAPGLGSAACAAQASQAAEQPAGEPGAAPPQPGIVPFWRRIDWRDPRNQMMLGLGVGSLVIVKVAFRKMTE
jgi:hypothetical protein